MAETLEKNEENEELYSLDITNEEAISESVNEKPKEYQKLLFADEARLKVVKARKLISMGLFYQNKLKPEEINFNELKKLEYAKKYKDHTLYEKVSDGTLFYILPLVEESKDGDKTTYAYDVVELDNVDEETYQKLVNAHSHEGNALLTSTYVCAWVFSILAVISLIYSVFYLVTGMGGTSYNFFTALFYYNGSSLCICAVAAVALVIAVLAKKNHDNNK
jgi:hypothetical protein